MATQPSYLPTIFVIFGATGDLASQKIIPALFRLHQKKLLPPLFQIVGFSRREMSTEEFRETIKNLKAFKNHQTNKDLESFLKLAVYTQGLFDQKEGYTALATLLGSQDTQWKTCANKLFYLSTAPSHYTDIFKNLKKSGLTIPCSPEEGWTRVVVEKPFGKDAKTAENLDLLLGKLFREEQIYRIDHYLGKETVQNIMAFRFSNAIFEPSWNNKNIQSIHIKFWEKEGIGSRGEFYDATGALRDIGQNHLLQLLSLFMMENPGTLEAKKIHRERAKVIQKLTPLKSKDVAQKTIRGQYEGYKKEGMVAQQSLTETYFRLQASINTPRWKGVDILLEGGKKMSRSEVEVIITFKPPSPCLCPGLGSSLHYQNTLCYRIQPGEKITLSFWAKKPGPEMVVEEKDFSFDYQRAYPNTPLIDAYDKLLQDVIDGNQTLFVSTEEIKASWQFVDPIIDAWKKNVSPLVIYKPGEEEIK